MLYKFAGSLSLHPCKGAHVEETDSAGMRDEMTNGRTERVEAYGQGYCLYRNN